MTGHIQFRHLKNTKYNAIYSIVVKRYQNIYIKTYLSQFFLYDIFINRINWGIGLYTALNLFQERHSAVYFSIFHVINVTISSKTDFISHRWKADALWQLWLLFFSINNKNKVTQVYSPSLKKYSQALVFLKVLPKATNDIA